MTSKTFDEKFVINYKLQKKELVEYISELEAEVYEKNKILETYKIKIAEIEEDLK